tara:strand:- start:109 stop:1362 length:1254 start_codon:yes stop_codon:yes gene_type:complete
VQKKDCVAIKFCRLCESKNLKNVFDLGKTPLANSYSKPQESIKLKIFPLRLNLCKNCGHLQLSHSIRPEKMFSNYLYKTNTSKKNFLHFKKYATTISKTFKKNRGKILDIASNDGTFLSFFNKDKFLRIGIDPAKNLKKEAEKKGIYQINDFFTEKVSNKVKKKFGSFDIITANHVCAHVENLNDFFRGVKNLLNENSIFIFEVSYRGSVLKGNTFDTIYHEHLDYHALLPILKFSKKFGFHVINFDINDAQGGSIRIYISNRKKKIKLKKIDNQIFKEKNNYRLYQNKTYKNFKRNINYNKDQLNKILLQLKDKKFKIAGYGAAAKTTTLLHYFNLQKKNFIKHIFDDNKLKHGLCMPGTKIKIINPNLIDKKKIDILIIFAWNYSEFIMKKIKRNNKFFYRNGQFLIPFPKPKII